MEWAGMAWHGPVRRGGYGMGRRDMVGSGTAVLERNGLGGKVRARRFS